MIIYIILYCNLYIYNYSKKILIFRDGAQICYCGSSKCRGYINKSSQISDQNSSEDSESPNENVFLSKPEKKERKKRNLENRTAYNNENKLREVLFIMKHSKLF